MAYIGLPLDCCKNTPGILCQSQDRLGIDVEEPTKQPKWKNFLKKGAESALKYIPGGELVSSFLDSVTGGSLEKKVDRIEEKQNTSLDQLQQLARKA